MGTSDFVAGADYEDCAYHPVLLTQVFSDGSIGGISLVEGTQPRNCDLQHCGPELLTLEQVVLIKAHLGGFAERRSQGLSVEEALAPYGE